MENDIKLSICIATRNRGDYIGATLESIASQIQPSVEIVIIDGASVDDTEQVVMSYQGLISNLHYTKKLQNGGVDQDYDDAVSSAHGDYCWLMSDDDLLKPNAVEKILEGIKRAFSLIVVNAELCTFDFGKLLDRNRLGITSDRLYSPDEFDSLFRDISAYLGYIGAVVIRREIWMARDRERFFGSQFIHVGVIFQAPLKGSTLVIRDPLISIRFGNTTWRPREFEIRMILWTDLIWSLNGVSLEAKAGCYRKKPWNSIKSLFFYRAKGTFCIDDYRRHLKPRITSKWHRFQAFAIAIFPGSIANIIGLLFCRLPYRDSNVHLLDMRASRFYFKNLFRQKLPNKR